ncbi:ComEC/Rec2 family competence protein [uncultured Flavobacterium sp.]|uniref:ComEC/Rec2 family competence protein n=1 Tax=uncultured Flavobacterium sp. TaxID=165435 RepID=UPI0030C847E5
MDVLKYPIITIAFCFGLGIIIQNYLCFSLNTVLYSTVISSVLFIILLFYNRNKNTKNIFFGLITYFLILSISALSLYVHQDINHKNHYTNFDIKESNSIKGLVVETLKSNEFYTKFLVEIYSFNHQKSSGKILVYFSNKNPDSLQIGDLVSFQSEIKPIQKNYNPNTFDYSNYMANQNVFHQIKCFENDYYIESKVKNFTFYVNELRQKLVHSFDKHHFSIRTKSIINALLLGQKQQIDSETLNDYKNAGVVHILAISGLHIGIIYAFFNFIFGFLNRIKHGKVIKLVVIILLLWLFALISGMSASITRSVTMFSLIAFGTFLNRKNFMFNAVAASFLILLIYNPLYIFDVGFQLSYAAVFSILLFQPFYQKFYYSKNKIVVYITDLFLVSLAAQIGVLPFMMLYFKQVPTLFLLANFIVIPIATAVLIFGIVVLFLNFVYSPLALLLGKLISILVEVMNNYIHWLSSFQNYVIKNITFTPILTLGLYLLILSVIYWIYNPKNKRVLYVLCLVLSFQALYFYTKNETSHKNELIVFNVKESAISIFDANKITVFSNDSLITENQSIQEYVTAKFNPKVLFQPLENVLFFKNTKIIIVDESAIYNINLKPDVVIIRQNSRINIERLILTAKPKVIVADKSNSHTSIKRWKATCIKYKIPFHAIAEKGFYKM